MNTTEQLTERFLAISRRLMDEQNIGLKSLSRVTGMSETHITGIFKGKVGITLKTICRFAKVFGVEPWELIK